MTPAEREARWQKHPLDAIALLRADLTGDTDGISQAVHKGAHDFPTAALTGLRDGEFMAYIPPRIAALIESRTSIKRFCVGLRGIDSEATAVLESLRACASSWRGFPDTETGIDSQQKPAADSTWLSSGEAAAMAKVSRQAITKAIRQKRLPATKINGRYKISRQDHEQWLATRPNG